MQVHVFGGCISLSLLNIACSTTPCTVFLLANFACINYVNLTSLSTLSLHVTATFWPGVCLQGDPGMNVRETSIVTCHNVAELRFEN